MYKAVRGGQVKGRLDAHVMLKRASDAAVEAGSLTWRSRVSSVFFQQTPPANTLPVPKLINILCCRRGGDKKQGGGWEGYRYPWKELSFRCWMHTSCQQTDASYQTVFFFEWNTWARDAAPTVTPTMTTGQPIDLQLFLMKNYEILEILYMCKKLATSDVNAVLCSNC